MGHFLTTLKGKVINGKGVMDIYVVCNTDMRIPDHYRVLFARLIICSDSHEICQCVLISVGMASHQLQNL